jgi:hypothetical protein
LSSWGTFLAFTAKNFVGVNIKVSKPGTEDWPQGYGPDAKGVLTLPEIKMPPAAVIQINPAVPNTGRGGPSEVFILAWKEAQEIVRGWVPDLSGRAVLNMRAMVPMIQSFIWLKPNIEQTVYVPAGKDLSLKVFPLGSMPPNNLSNLLPMNLGSMIVSPTKINSLGRIEFQPPVLIVVEVVDNKGNPLSGIPLDGPEDSALTDRDGIARLKVAQNSSGKIIYKTVDLKKAIPVEISVDYKAGGAQDAGKPYTLTIPQSLYWH